MVRKDRSVSKSFGQVTEWRNIGGFTVRIDKEKMRVFKDGEMKHD